MQITMDDSRLINISQLKGFLEGTQKVALSIDGDDLESKYKFISKVVKRLNYKKLSKKDKQVVIHYLRKITGYKSAQLYRLVRRAAVGKLIRKVYRRTHSHKIYQAVDIKLLEETDRLHLRLNTLATKEILRREVEIFGKGKYANIAKVSISHIHNLRDHPIYQSAWINHTKARKIAIGTTKPPQSFGKPGCIRVDSVHQREIYHINAVDEVTQWEITVTVSALSERYLVQALQEIIAQFPFPIFAFHSDRGGEYINYTTAHLLNKLFIEQTKSRSRHCNDNALVEGKNGSVIRKNFGWEPISQELVTDFNQFYKDWFNPYINYHRPSLYAEEIIIDKYGKKRKLYNQATTPYEKLKEICDQKRENYLKSGLTFNQLDVFAYAHSDNDFAALMRKAEQELFTKNQKLQNLTNQKTGKN